VRRTDITAIALLAVMSVAGLLAQPSLAVRVTTGDGQRLACNRVAPGTEVILAFTHSMYGGDVTETWQVERSGLHRVSMVTDNAAAAEYYAWDGRIVRQGDRFEVTTDPLAIEQLVVRVDQIGRHRLTIGNHDLTLAAMVDESAQVRIDVLSGPALLGDPC